MTALGFCIAAIILAARSLAPAAHVQTGRRYMRLRRDPAVLAALLSNSRALQLPQSASRLTVGPADAPVALAIVTGPYCPACAEAHAQLHTLTMRAGLRAAVLFLCDVQQDVAGVRAVIAAHALAGAGRSEEAHELIDAWFDCLRARRAFDERPLASLYDSLPPEAVAAAKAALAEQQQWIFGAGIDATPVVLLYGRRLPAHYRLEELQDIDFGAVERLMSLPPAAVAPSS
jgi:hypothetical protein